MNRIQRSMLLTVLFRLLLSKRLTSLSLCIVLCVWSGFSGTRISAEEPSSATSVVTQKFAAEDLEFFEKHIRPLLIEKCLECHNHEEASGGLRLDSRDGVVAGGDSGKALIPGDPGSSRMIAAIRYQSEHLQMPPEGKLDERQIDLLVHWVKLGAPDSRDAVILPTEKTIGMSIEEGRSFWSFKPLSQPEIPSVVNAAWVENPIDAFILHKLESVQLQPAEESDDATWLRRVSLNLIGLPPTAKELEEFLHDHSPHARDVVIERLLASPQYGIRWGRHWLDVARYADSNGLDENLAYGNAWRYRDYVVDAFNSDKPFDEFIAEQIAGDLIENASSASRSATGFLALGARVLAEPDRTKLVMDTIDEQLDTVGKAFLGLTFGCARCHDHKFDPIKQRDYYAMAGIFRSTRSFADTNTGAIKHWFEHSFATPEELAELKKIDESIAAKNAEATNFKNAEVSRIRQSAREAAAIYLAASTQFDTSASLKQVASIAEPLGLHPRILHHCRIYLQHHPDDPMWSSWHELQGSHEATTTAFDRVKQHYQELFDQANKAWSEAKSLDANVQSLTEERLEFARRALEDATGFLAVPPQAEYALDEESLKRYYELLEAARVLESNAPDETAAMGVAEGDVHADLPIHVRGSHRNLGENIPRGFPEVMIDVGDQGQLPPTQSGRLEFAKWIANAKNPLTARVIVNRVWRWHFGQALVTSTENFGVLGSRPTHPELLDWLANWFIDSGWSLKSLHRLILSSRTYQMSSIHFDVARCAEMDPENQWMWKFPIQRMEAEQIRDSILFLSGRLDDSIGGKTVPLRNRQFVFNHTSVDHTEYNSLRRAIFLPVIRNNLYPFFEQFDFPDPTMPTGSRNSTVVAPQALLIMNDVLIMDSADALAQLSFQQHADPSARVCWLYQQTLSRQPTEKEVRRSLSFIDDMQKSIEVQAVDSVRAWSLLCHSLLASNEFIFIR